MGVETENTEAEWLGYIWGEHQREPKAKPWLHRAVRLSWEAADVLIWNQIARDIGVYPQAPIESKLVDPDRGICVYAYDDRGMDITALRSEDIARLHREFDAWLLDYDRPRMSEAF
jgi:hypothetical protein